MNAIIKKDEILVLPKIKKPIKLTKIGTVILKDVPNVMLENTEIRIYRVKMNKKYYMKLSVKKPGQQLKWGETIRPFISGDFIANDVYEGISNEFGGLTANLIMETTISINRSVMLLQTLQRYELMCKKPTKLTMCQSRRCFGLLLLEAITANSFQVFSCKE